MFALCIPPTWRRVMMSQHFTHTRQLTGAYGPRGLFGQP